MEHSCPPIPAVWRERLQAYAWQEIAIGRSAASVHRLTLPDGATLFVKAQGAGAFADLAEEAARLRWLAASSIPCPAVLDSVSDGERRWLLLSTVPGVNLAEADLPPGDIVEIAVRALQRLHALDPSSCPFDHQTTAQIGSARARLQAGCVDEDDFDAERLGLSAAELMRQLEAGKPSFEDLVVTHGDACLPNLLADHGAFSGFVDCGRLGLADRHQDLALASRSIDRNLGRPWGETFLNRYGGEIDRDRLEWYRLLDEFF